MNHFSSAFVFCISVLIMDFTLIQGKLTYLKNIHPYHTLKINKNFARRICLLQCLISSFSSVVSVGSLSYSIVIRSFTIPES